MSNFHDAAWAEKMREQMPPVRYSMTVEDMIVFFADERLTPGCDGGV